MHIVLEVCWCWAGLINLSWVPVSVCRLVWPQSQSVVCVPALLSPRPRSHVNSSKNQSIFPRLMMEYSVRHPAGS